MSEGKSSHVVTLRLTAKEIELLVALEKQLSLTRTEIIKARLFRDADKLLLNTKDVLKQLDQIGLEMHRVGTNINQLARHANTLNLKGQLGPEVIIEFNRIFENYLDVQRLLEISLRKIIRSMGK